MSPQLSPGVRDPDLDVIRGRILSPLTFGRLFMTLARRIRPDTRLFSPNRSLDRREQEYSPSWE